MNKHTAEYKGRTFKRNSANRVYKFAILQAGSVKADRERGLKMAARSFKTNAPFYQGFVDGTSRFLVRNSWEKDDAAYEARVAEDKAKAEAYLAGGLERHIADVNKHYDALDIQLDADRDTYYVCIGWTTGATKPKAGQFYVEAKLVTK